MAPRATDFEEALERPSRGAGAVTAAGLVLAAAVAGVAVGLLMPPETGENIRERVRERMRSKFGDLSEGFGRRIRTFRDEGNGALRRIEKRLNKLEDQFDSARDGRVGSLPGARRVRTPSRYRTQWRHFGRERQVGDLAQGKLEERCPGNWIRRVRLDFPEPE
jgi:hypothetical protein